MIVCVDITWRIIDEQRTIICYMPGMRQSEPEKPFYLFKKKEVRCQRCHRELTAFADLGVVVGIDMNKKRSKEEVDRLEMYMSHLVGVLRDTEE